MFGIKKLDFENQWKLIVEALASFRNHHCSRWAAALAYYGIIAIFPLILFIIFMGGKFLQTADARQLLDSTMLTTVPFAMDNINEIIDQTINSSSSLGIISILGLIWSGSGVFNVLVAAMNVIWDAKPHPYWQRRVMAAMSVLILGIVFLASFFLLPILSWFGSALGLKNYTLYSSLFEIIIGVLTIYLIFRIFPNRTIKKRAAFIGALIGICLIEIAKYGFMAYLGTVIERYGSIYGSIAWVVALGLWMYLLGILFFLSAEIGAGLERRYAQK